MVIDLFTGDYSFLSNFHPSPVEFKGDVYKTVEHAYQAAKTEHPEEREQIRNAFSPGAAKRLGKRVHLRPDWENIKVGVMKSLLEQKFEDPVLAQQLIDTDPHELVEGNSWGDTFWGVCDGVGENVLGVLLMEVRANLMAEQDHSIFVS